MTRSKGETNNPRVWISLPSVLVIAALALAQTPPPARNRPAWHRAPYLSLSDPRTVSTRYAGENALARSFSGNQARALSTTHADFDEDGMPDLVAGFSTSPGAGAVAVHRGNIDAPWPYGALRGTDPPAFLSDARVFPLPEAPAFLAAGDFDADGHQDLVAARSGTAALYFLPGDGHGGFAEARRIPLPGSVTALTAGEIDRPDGLTDLIVAVTGNDGPQVLVFESPDGALRGTPEAFPLPAGASSLAVTPLDGGLMNGIAVGAGRELLLIHGRDRKLTRSKADRDAVAPAVVTRQSLPFAIRSLAVGRFTSAAADLAALGDDGQLHILERSDADTPVQFDSAPLAGGHRIRPRGRAGAIPRTSGMNSRTAIALPLSVGQPGLTGARLVTARVAATGRDSLVLIDPAGGKLHIVSHAARGDGASLAVSASLDVAGPPAAVEPMRINKDALSDLVVLTSQQVQPIVLTTAPDYILTVLNTTDSGNNSLRSRIDAANALYSAGFTAEVDFDIPATDPNRDPTTGVFTIQPIFQNALVALSTLGGITVDGYTQPGASPNTLTAGDNAHLLIEVNGSMAGKGPNGLALFGGVNVVRGLTVTNFLGTPDSNDPRYVDGGGGFDMESDSNIVEGNFVGIDAGGTFAKPNSAGIFTYTGPATSFGQTIGGTTPQARNLISGNSFEGIFDASPSYVGSFNIQGNYIGTDKSGAHAVPNNYAGIRQIGVNGEVGGTVAGAGNLISANTQFGVIAEVVGGGGNNIQGNLVGADVTGTQSLTSGAAVGIGQAYAEGNLIGGTTPQARNLISGNGAQGIWFVGGAENDSIQGNYIGVDITGTQSLPNGNFGIDFDTDFHDIFGGFHAGGPVTATTVGGEAAGAANVISGNAGGGILIDSKPGFPMNNTIAGNLIGTDAAGVSPLGNQGDGIRMVASSTLNTVGGTDAAAANTIAYNTGNGVTIDPGGGAPFGASSDSVTGNFIYSNGGTGVRIISGTANTVGQNRIYNNGALGIDIDAAGVQANSACQANTAGANSLQNAPVLTAGAGSTFVTATATDPAGNTSEFSNCVATSLSANMLSIAGSFSGLPSTAYTIEYFSTTACDPSGYGQGTVYLGSTAVTTPGNCTASLNNTLDLTKADLSITNTSAQTPIVNMTFPFTSVVSDNGPIAATSVIWSDVLPSGVNFLAATATQGTCGFSAGIITCNLGTLPVGRIVTISASVVPASPGTFSNTVTVAAATPDSNTANNSATFTKAIVYDPYLNHLSPASVYIGSPDLPLNIVGQGFTSSTTVLFNGVSYPATLNTAWNPNDCGPALFGGANYCTALAITVPASQFTVAATVQAGVSGMFGPVTLPFNVVAPPPVIGPATHLVLSGISTPFASGALGILTVTAKDAGNNTVTTYTGTVNLTSSDPAPTVFTAGGGTATLIFTPNGGGQASAIVSLQTMGTQSLTATDAANPTLSGSLTGIVVSHGPAAAMTLSGSPQATPPGHPFTLPLSVTVTDLYGNPVPNQTIAFTVPTTGASAILSNGTATTNSLGVASVTASANAISGAYAVGVTFGAGVAGGGDNADVFLLTNGTGLATLTATGGTPQSTFVGQLFATQLQATLLDGLGNPISRATVYFSSGSVNGASALVTGSAATNASGVATATANAPLNSSPGTFPVTAVAGGLTATFTLTELPPTPVVLTIAGGSPQTTSIGTAFGAPLAVHVTDGSGVARPGVVVTYIPPTAGASATLSAGTASTDGAGNASLVATANTTQGAYNVTASVGSVTVDFVLTNGPPGGAPASIAAAAGTPQTQFVHQAFATALQVLVKDASNTPVAGASVTFSAPLTGASGTFAGSATVATNGNGIATAPTFTANTVAGSYAVTATVGTLSTTFSLTNVGGSPVSLNIFAGNNQSATVNTSFGTALAVQMFDTYGNAVGANWAVTLIPVPGTSGAAGTFSGSTSLITDSHGVATASTLTANGIAGDFNVLAFDSQNFAIDQTFTLTNTLAVPAAIAAVSGTPQSVAAGAVFPAALAARVTDSGGTPLAGFTVTFMAPSSGASAMLSGLSALTNSSGIAMVNVTANTVGGSYNVTAAIGSHTAAFALTNTGGALDKCDVNLDGIDSVLDVQVMINEALGSLAMVHDLDRDGIVSVVDGQIVLNAAIGNGCSAK